MLRLALKYHFALTGARASWSSDFRSRAGKKQNEPKRTFIPASKEVTGDYQGPLRRTEEPIQVTPTSPRWDDLSFNNNNL